MNAISFEAIFMVVVTFFISLLSVGGVFLRILRLKYSNIIFRATVNIALGTSLIPIITLVLTPFKLLNSLTVTAITLLMFIVTLLEGLGLLKREFFKIKQSLNATFFLLIIITSISAVLRFVPVLGMYVHPGDDAKMHTLLAKLIVENKGYPSTWGKYAPPGAENSPIMYQMGFHSIVAFIYFLTQEIIPISQITLIISQIYNWILILPFYLLAKNISSNNKLALISALLLSIAPHPLGMFSYGGNAELPSLFISLTLLSYILTMEKVRAVDLKSIALISILLTGTAFMHLTVFLLTIALIIFLILTFRTRIMYLKALVTSLLITVTILAISKCNVFIYSSVGDILEKNAFADYFSTLWWRYEFNYFADSFKKLPSFIISYPKEPIFFNYFLIMVCVVIAVLTSIVYSKKYERKYAFLLYWICILLILIMNNPSGPYFFKFPGWYIFIPGKLIGYLIFPILISISLGIVRLFENKRLRYVVLILMILFTIFVIPMDLEYMNWARIMGEPITTADIEAFDWILKNTREDSTFLVTDCDAGQWIPIFTNRRVIPMFVNFQGEFFVNKTYWDEVVIISGFHIGMLFEKIQLTPDAQDTLLLLKKYGIDYIYIGAKSIYGRKCNISDHLKISKNYEKVYDKNGVEIFFVHPVKMRE